VIALTTDVPAPHRLRTLLALVGGLVTLLVSHDNEHAVEILSALLPHVHVLLVRPDSQEKLSAPSVDAIRSLLHS
jgi:hypothetical protein